MTWSLFVTKLFEAEIEDEPLLDELAHSIRSFARDDAAGRNWSNEHRYSGYTSYASLNDLQKRDPAFAEFAAVVQKPVKRAMLVAVLVRVVGGRVAAAS